MVLKVSQRGKIPPFIVMDVMRAAREREEAGDHIIHMEVGQPGTPAPSGVRAAAAAAVQGHKLGYTDALGVPELRSRISQHYLKMYNVTVDPGRIVVTTGSSGGFVLSFLSLFDAGDRVALASPGYPAYRNILRAMGIEPVDIMVGPEENFQPTPGVLDKIAGDIDGLIIASPSNPTGTMIHRTELKAIADYCTENEIRLVSDEIYHGITYGEPAETALAFSDDVIIINSFSKYFSMTGWRVGWMVVPENIIRPIECLAQNLFISPPTLSQYAAIAAFDCEQEVTENIARYSRNRAILLDELPKAGFDKLAAAEGAFYIYADVTGLTDDSEVFCKKMLTEAGVAATPGTDFDPQRGRGYVRFSFAGETDDMAEAARRLRDWLKIS